MRGRRAAALMVAVLLLAASPAAGYARSEPPPRRVSEEYADPTVGVVFPTYAMATCFSGCVVIEVLEGERYAHVEVDDSVSPTVAFKVFPWEGGNSGRYVDGGDFCGATDEPIKLPRWTYYLWIEVLVGPCSDGSPATATQGVVTAVLSSTPGAPSR